MKYLNFSFKIILILILLYLNFLFIFFYTLTIIHITYSRLILFSIINSVKELSCLSLIISENILFYYFLVKINFTKNKELSIKSIRFKKYESYFVKNI